MLDFGQFDFDQRAEIELAEVEQILFALFLLFVLFSSLSFSLSFFFFFFLFFFFFFFLILLHFLLVLFLFLFLSPKTFALNPNPKTQTNPKRWTSLRCTTPLDLPSAGHSAGPPPLDPQKFSLFFSLTRHSFHSLLLCWSFR